MLMLLLQSSKTTEGGLAMNDTPRTDAIVRRLIDNDQSPDQLEHFAKELERELNAFVRLALGDDVDLTQPGIAVEALAQLKNDIREAAGHAAALQGAKWGQEVVISQLRDEIARLRAGGCARDQKTTQFCAEAVDLERKLEAWKAYAGGLEGAGDEMAKWFPFSSTHMKRVVGEWTEARRVKL